MARLRQQYPQNYRASANIHTEFESVIRYLNAAELGNKTLSELLSTLFDEEGNFDGPIEMRVDSTHGLQYRIGEYDATQAESGWLTLAALDDLRGAAGENLGTIGEPVMSLRADLTAEPAQDEFDIAHTVADTLLVYNNGVLLRPLAEYTSNPAGGTTSTGSITLTTPCAGGEQISILRVRANAQVGFSITQHETSSPQSSFPVAFGENDSLLVYVNGVLQREGLSNDYYTDHLADIIVFNTPVTAGNLVTIHRFAQTGSQPIAGIMTEAQYVDAASGLIPYSKLKIADAAIAQAKVYGLVAALSDMADITYANSTPNPVTKFWVDTSQTPNQLKYWNGVAYLNATPSNTLPVFNTDNAGLYVRVNPTGTALIYDSIDLSSVIPKTYLGAANGVATLDSTGKLPITQLPVTVGAVSLYHLASGAVADGQIDIHRLFGHKAKIVAIALRTDAGTCNVQITQNGTPITASYTASIVPNEIVLGSAITVDATGASMLIGVLVAGAAACSDLDISIAIAITPN